MTIADSILYTALKAIKIFIVLTPLRIALLFGRSMGLAAYILLPSRRRLTESNIRSAFPEEDEDWCRNTARTVFLNFGRNTIELIKFSAGRLTDIVETGDMSIFDTGVVLMTGHLGNWEITGMALAAAGKELYPIGRRIHSPAFDRIVDDLRTKYGSHHIPYKGSIKEILRKIKNNKNLCVLIDQHMRSGIPCTFFGRPVWATHITSVLHRKTGVDIVPSFSRHAGGRIKVDYGEPFYLEKEGDSLRADFINTQRQMRWLEGKIREKPDEWFWLHNFWKYRWPAAFLDRDGTINMDYGYVSEIEKLEFIPGAIDAMRKLKKAGFMLIIITNQSGIARGLYTERDFSKLNDYFLEKLESEGVFIDKVYYCAHHPDDDCHNRKPNPGMIEKALSEFNIDTARSVVIGDKRSDIELGSRLNIKTCMVMTGCGKEHVKDSSPDIVAQDLSEAAHLIIDEKKK